MGLFNWAQKKIKQLSIWDLAILKTSLIIFGIIIGAYISTFVIKYVLYFVGAFIVFYAILIGRLFREI